MIESDLKRIADALEGMLSKMDVPTTTVIAKKPAAKVKTPPKQEAAPATVAAPPIPVAPPAATVTPPPAPVVVVMTPEELNAALGVEFGRLGGREPIDAAMNSLGVDRITDLKPEQYSVLMEKVRAVAV